MKILQWMWRHLEVFLGSIFLAIIVIVTSINVFMRYILNAPLEGASEIATVLFVWLVMLGIAAAAKDKSHPRIDALIQVLPVKVRIALETVIMLLVIILLIDFMIRGWHFAWTSGFQKRVGMFDISYVYVYLALPIGFGLTLIRVLYHFIIDMRDLIQNKKRNSYGN